MEFKELKKIVLEIAEERQACEEGYDMACLANSKEELLSVIKGNISWCHDNGLTTVEILDYFTEELCNRLGIFYKGYVNEIRDKRFLILLNDVSVGRLTKSHVIKMFDNSVIKDMHGVSVINQMRDSSSIDRAGGNSIIDEMRNRSSINEIYCGTRVYEMRDHSLINFMKEDSYVNMMSDKSLVNVIADFSVINRMRDSSKVKMMSSCSVINKMRNNSKVYQMWGKATIGEMHEESNINEMHGHSMVRSYNDRVPEILGERSCFINILNNKIYTGKKIAYENEN